MTKNRYSMSFTTATLLYRESLTIAELLEQLGDWDQVRQRVIEDNLLQMRTLNASKRVYHEVASRLKQLTSAELALLRTGTRQEQNHMLWLAVCKRYRFIYDFAVEEVREKFLRLDLHLGYDDYDIYFYSKAEWHPEVAGVTETTRKKQRQVVFKTMREADLLTQEEQILPAMLTPREIETIAADSPAYLALFPVSPAEPQEWLP